MRMPAPSKSRFTLFQRNDPLCIAAHCLRRTGILLLLLIIMPRMGAAPSSAPSSAPNAAPSATSSSAPGATSSATPRVNRIDDPTIDTSAEPSATSGTATGAAAAASETLLLEVYVNGHSIGKIGEFILRRGKLMARPDELHALGFRVPLSHASETGGLIALSDLPGVTYSIDEENQPAIVPYCRQCCSYMEEKSLEAIERSRAARA